MLGELRQEMIQAAHQLSFPASIHIDVGMKHIEAPLIGKSENARLYTADRDRKAEYLNQSLTARSIKLQAIKSEP